MDIQNVNGTPNAGKPTAKNQGISDCVKSKPVGKAKESQETVPENETIEQAIIQPAKDMFQTTEDSELVRKLTEMIEDSEELHREEAVDRARSRVSEGYLCELSAILINSGSTY